MNFRTDRRNDRVRSVLSMRQPDLAVVAENIHDPHNVSAIMRSCDATGVGTLCLVYNTCPFPDFKRHGKKSSAGARKWIDREEFNSPAECFEALRAKGFRVYVSALAPDARSLYELNLAQKVALVFGNEKDGVSKEAQKGADGLFQIPMVGMVQSLNVSVAVAVTLYETFRQRQAAGLYESSRMDPKILDQKAEEWLKQ